MSNKNCFCDICVVMEFPCSGNTAMVETLLAAGADVDAVGGDMRTTALIEAAHYADDANCVALLAERANDVDATNKYGDTALFFAVQGQCPFTLFVARSGL